MLNGRRPPRILFALVMLVPLVVASPRTHAQGGASSEADLAPAAAAAPRSDGASLIVRLDGPTIWDVYQADRARTAVMGTAPMSRMTLRAVNDAIERDQLLAQRAIEAAGGEVADRYQNILNGFLVHATPDQAALIARLPNVLSVARAPLVEPALADSVPHMGAPRVWNELNYNGRGTLVAVLDTGVDYTHGTFGGSGNPDDYASNNENLVESGTFPTKRVVGGYDFAGKRYTVSIQCGPHPGQECDPTPRPDDDPLDTRGHGTHVSGIIAGRTTSEVSSGVAPGANLVALKIFGNPILTPVVTDLLASAFEWVADNNLELDVPGFATERIDIVNISVTGSWRTGWDETERIVRAGAERGLTIIVPAGNEGSYTYLGDPISGAEESVSVASTYAPGEHALLAAADWRGEGGSEALDALALDSWIVGQTSAVARGGFQGQLAWMGVGCDDQPPLQDLSGKIALVERGVCGFAEKLLNAQAAGATAAIVFTTPDLRQVHMGGQAEIAIPAVMIDYAPGRQLADTLVLGRTVDVRVYEPTQDLLADTLSPFSSRGPARLTGGLRPQLAAPGSFIYSAWPGTGQSGLAQSGTSMAAAHVAGLAAILAERNRQEKLGLGALDLGALAINYALPDVKIGRADTGPLAPLAHQGAGRVDAFRSASGKTVVRSDRGVAELGFGNVHATNHVARATRQIAVRNLSDAGKVYRSEVQLAFPAQDVGKGVTLTASPANLFVGPKQTGQLSVDLEVDPALLPPWPFTDSEAVIDPEALAAQEVDGFVRLTEVDGSGQPVAGGDQPAVPFLVLPRRHSCVASTTPSPFILSGPTDRITQSWLNPCPEASTVRLYPLLATDPTDAQLPGAVDIEAVGMRYGAVDPDNPESDTFLEWIISTRGPRRIPWGTQFRIYIDLNQDGVFDWVLFTMYGPDLDIWLQMGLPAGRWISAHAPLAPGVLVPDYALTEGKLFFHNYDLDESVTRLYVLAEDLGLDMAIGGERFNYAVSVADVKGDYPLIGGEDAHDYAPDGLVRGEGFTYDQWVQDCVLPQSNETVPGGGELTVSLSSRCPPPDPGVSEPIGVFMNYPSNLPGEAQYELRAGTLSGDATPPRYPVYLPYGLRNHG